MWLWGSSLAGQRCGSAAAGQQLPQELALELELEKEQERQLVARSLAANSSDLATVTLNIGEQVCVRSPTSLSSGANTILILVPLLFCLSKDAQNHSCFQSSL